MQKVIFISESLKSADGGSPVHVTGDAQYDEDKGELIVQLTESLKNQSNVIRQQAPRDEARDLARDIFHSWVRKLVQQGNVSIEGT